MQTLNCSVWDLVPWPEIEPGPPALGAQSLSPWTTREVPNLICFLDASLIWLLVRCFTSLLVVGKRPQFFHHLGLSAGLLEWPPDMAAVSTERAGRKLQCFF